MDVDGQGRVFVSDGSNICHVRAYDADGRLLPFSSTARGEGDGRPATFPAAVDYVSGYGGSVRLDPAGNLYLLQYGLPKKHRPPRL